MIDLCLWQTPTGQNATRLMEKAGAERRLHRAGIGIGDWFQPSFLNGALYLAEKSGRFVLADARV